jgi:hypothetical protein
VIDKDWKGFLELLKSWKKNPSSFTEKPKPPNYSKSAKTFIVGWNGFRISDEYLYISGGKKIGW